MAWHGMTWHGMAWLQQGASCAIERALSVCELLGVSSTFQMLATPQTQIILLWIPPHPS
jgi:hypothetical protein